MITHKDIDQVHAASLSSISRSHQVGGDYTLQRLYLMARKVLMGTEPDDASIHVRKREHGEATSVMAIDSKSGVFVELTGVPGTPKGHLLTAGTICCMEAHNPTHSTTDTKIW